MSFDDNILGSFELLIIVCSLVLLAFFMIIIILFSVFQKRKIKFINQRNEAILRYQEEVARTQVEIQEETLKNVGRELHDNIGQLISVANLELKIFGANNHLEKEPELIEITNLLGKSLSEIRALSKNLNNDIITHIGLQESIKNELNRLERLKFLNTAFNIQGAPFSIPKDDTIILFRIVQEFLSNVIKHAKASSLEVMMLFKDDFLEILAQDDGIGFDQSVTSQGSGLLNMHTRAQMIRAEFELNSTKNKGTRLKIKYIKV